MPAALSGYIQSVNIDALLRLAGDNRTIVRMEHGIGAFVVQNTALVSLALTYPPDQKMIDALNGAYSIGPHRTVDQDPAFGIRQIVDMAIKALSPGVNDTSTAVMCVDYLTSIMARLAGRQFPPLYRYEGETLRVIANVPSFEELLAESFDQNRGSAEVNVAILARGSKGGCRMYAKRWKLSLRCAHRKRRHSVMETRRAKLKVIKNIIRHASMTDAHQTVQGCVLYAVIGYLSLYSKAA